jgi:hypothetical protein
VWNRFVSGGQSGIPIVGITSAHADSNLPIKRRGMMATLGEEITGILGSDYGFLDGSYWLKTETQKGKIKQELRLCVKILHPRYRDVVQRQLDAIDAHEQVDLHPRDRVVFICGYNDVKLGATGTLVQMNPRAQTVQVLVDGSDAPVQVAKVVLDPESPHPGPKDIYTLTAFEKSTVEELVRGFFNTHMSPAEVFNYATEFGLVKPLLYRLHTNYPQVLDRILRRRGMNTVKQTFFNDFFDVFIHTSTQK